MKRIWKEYFSFSKKERVAVLLLLLLMAAFLIAPYLAEHRNNLPAPDPALEAFLADSGPAVTEGSSEPGNSINTRLFPFDPNTLDEEGWRRLGIPAGTIRTLLNYRRKGGRFRTAEDIRRIWGIRSADAARLIPYIRIAAAGAPAAYRERAIISDGKKEPIPIDINTASDIQWASLPGIGNLFAGRIVRFRERIGGFTSIEQVRRTYGLTDSQFNRVQPYLRFNPAHLPPVNINTATVQDLRSRLSIPYPAAAAIVRYRETNGPLANIDDLEKGIIIHDSIMQKLRLRCTVQ